MANRLSIIVPVYNAGCYLKECINSILNQDYKYIRVILVNDGSTDDSANICKEIAKQDERVSYIEQNNAGVSKTRNKGIKFADSEFLMFVDADDLLESGIIKKMMIYADSFDFIMCGYATYNGKNKQIINSYECMPYEGDAKGFAENFDEYLNPPFLLGPCFKVFRFDLIKNNNIYFPEELSYGEDAVFVMNYLTNVTNVKCISDVGYYYRKDGNTSLSSRFLVDKIDINNRINELIFNLLRKNGVARSGDICNKRLLDYLTSYTQELVLQSENFSEMKRIFYQKVHACNGIKKNSNVKAKNFSQTIVCCAANHRLLSFLLLLFRFSKRD